MNQVSWTSILIGLALFLFGIDYLSLSLQELSPTRLKNLLAKCTSSTFKAILIGCFITCIIQSSSATTALTVSLINANLMTFSQSIGIIMGANIGTTITAFIVGFDLFQYASFFLIIGAFCLLFSNHPKIKGLAQILFGLGCLFYGLELNDECSLAADSGRRGAAAGLPEAGAPAGAAHGPCSVGAQSRLHRPEHAVFQHLLPDAAWASHYASHGKLGQVLGVSGIPVPRDRHSLL